MHRRPTLRYFHQTSLKASYSFIRAVSGNTPRQGMTASNTAFTVFSAIGLVLSLIPLWWHLESWNVGTCMFMIWTALTCLVFFVDSIAWSGNIINWTPVWCDIGEFRNPFIQFSYLTRSIQPFAFRLVSLSHGLLVLFALFAAFTRSLPLLPFQPPGLLYVEKPCCAPQHLLNLFDRSAVRWPSTYRSRSESPFCRWVWVSTFPSFFPTNLTQLGPLFPRTNRCCPSI